MMLKNLKKTTLVAALALSSTIVISQEKDECKWAYGDYVSIYKKEKNIENSTFEQAFPLWEKAYKAECTTGKYKKNVSIHGIQIVKAKLATDANNKTYKVLLLDLLTKRAEIGDKSSEYFEGEILSNAKTYGLLDSEEIQTRGLALLKKEENENLSVRALGNIFLNAKELYESNKINFETLYSVYELVNESVDKGITATAESISGLKTKRDSLGQALTKKETKRLPKLESKLESLGLLIDGFSNDLSDQLNCDNLSVLFDKDYETKKDDLKWLSGVSKALSSSECGDDHLFYTKVSTQIGKLVPDTPAESSSGATKSYNSYQKGMLAAKGKKWNSAIDYLKKALNEETKVSNKGNAAYNIALAYYYKKEYSTARTYANKAANYKKGWGSPYMLIAGMYQSSANSCGTTEFDKRATYWVAADMYRKAARVDGRIRSKANRYASRADATAPDNRLIFKSGKSKGATHRVGCWIGATTKIR